jgi:hypothetical protein
MVDGVPQLILISSAVGGDCLPCSVSYCIRVSGPEGWSLVSTEHIGSTDDLHYFLVLFSARAQNSLDSKFWRSGDVDMFQQIPQSASENRGFISKSFDFVSVVEYLVLLGVASRSVVFIFFAFILVAIFFFFFIVFFLLLVVGLWHRLSLLRVFSCRYCDYNLEWFLLLG